MADRILKIANMVEEHKELNSGDWKYWMGLDSNLKRGIFDGFTSAKLNNPTHSQWKMNMSGKIAHFNDKYLKGYKLGYLNRAPTKPFCLQ